MSKSITEFQLFCILFSVRLSSALLTEKVTLQCVVFQFALTCALSVSAYFISRKMKSGIRSKTAAFACAIAVSVPSLISLIDFRNTAAPHSISLPLMLLILACAVAYSAYLGTESAARFSLIGAAALTVCTVAGVLGNLKGVSPVDFSVKTAGVSALSLIKCADIPIVWLLYYDKIKRSPARALCASVFASYFAFGLLFLMCGLKLKGAAEYYPYPFFTLLQLAQAGDFNKLDILFTVPLIVGEYLKYSSVFARLKNEKSS